MGETRDRMIADLRLHGYADGTQTTYLGYAERFVAHFMVHPARLNAENVREYMLFLEDEGYAASTRAIHQAAIKFLYNVTLEKPEVVEDLVRPKVGVRLPDILSHSEIQRVFDHVRSLRVRTVAMAIYGAGLRVSEACTLSPEDIDSKRMLIHVRQAKGDKGRFVMLSRRLLQALRAYWVLERPEGPFLFASAQSRSGHISPRTIRQALRRAAEAAGVTKKVTPHVLRHCFATHLLDLGADTRQVQLLLGHASIQSTARYTQMSIRRIAATKSPLDASAQEARELG